MTQRTTAMGLWTDASQFFEAATILTESKNRRVSSVTYYLLGHAIELVLKSFLLSQGKSLKILKNHLGHNLSCTLEMAMAQRNNGVNACIAEYRSKIELLNQYYSAKHFEYRVTGTKTLPRPQDLMRFLERMLGEVRPLARQSLK
ncbi:MAG: hypothetical protein WCF16_03340 [Alphaproteobacteria bacterium]